jgi:biotin transport system substrate-specific component
MTIGLPGIDRLPSLDRARAGERGITIGDFLVPIRVSERIGSRLRHITLIVAGTLLIAVGATISYPVPGTPVPVTGQTFGVLVAGGALGLRRGIAASGLYVLLGIVGLPFFAQGESGAEVVSGARGGYLIGFIAAAATVGGLAELGWDRKLVGSVGAMLLATLAIYVVGVPWLAVATGHDLAWGIENGVVPFVPFDVLKLALAAAVFPAAWWVVGHRPGDR